MHDIASGVIEVLWWPHGGHGDCASERTGYGVRQWARPAGTRVGWRFTALQRYQRCCRFEAFTVVPSWKVLRASDGSAKAENASLAKGCGHPRTGGAEACRATMPQPRWMQWAPFWAFCYVITDLRIYPPPSPSCSPSHTLRPGHAHPQIKLPPVMSFRKLTGRHRTLWTDTGSAGAARRPAPHLRTALSRRRFRGFVVRWA